MQEKNELTICFKCGEIHTKCLGHPHLKNSPDGKFHPCRNEPMENGNCRMHGGATPKGVFSQNFKHGRRSKYLNDVKGKRKKLLEESTMAGNKLPDVIDELGIERMRLRELVQLLDDSTIREYWREILLCASNLRELICDPPEIKVGDDMKDPETVLQEKREMAIFSLWKILDRISENNQLFKDIHYATNRIRKMEETNAKLREANVNELIKKQRLIPVEHFSLMIENVAIVLQQSPMDIRVRQINDLKEIYSKLPQLIQEPILLEE